MTTQFVTTVPGKVAAGIAYDEEFSDDGSADRFMMGVTVEENLCEDEADLVCGICGAENSEERALLDSGSGEHVCPKDWHDELFLHLKVYASMDSSCCSLSLS